MSDETGRSTNAFAASLPGNPGTLYRQGTLLWLAGISMLTVPMVTLVDISLARWFDGDPLSREVGQMLDLMLFFSHGTGIFLILVGILMLAPRRRWHVPRLAALAMGAGAVATIMKLFVLRPRPNALNLDIATYELALLWAFDWQLEQFATFDATTRAFPSGSSATATAFAVGLWIALPRGKWLFATLCLGTFLQRLYCGAHFLSDLFGGTAIGLMWAYVCYHPSLLGSVFDKMEPEFNSRLRSRSPAKQTDEITGTQAADDASSTETEEPTHVAA